jgi:O-antigen/teichoic acid export membrane protein
MKTSRTKKAVLGTLTGVVHFMVLALMQVLLTPIILRMAGQETFGAYVIVMQIIGYGLLVDFGLSVAISRYLSQNFNANDGNSKFKSTFNLGRYFLLATNALFALTLLILSIKVEIFITGNSEIITDVRRSIYIISIWTVLRTPLLIYNHSLLASQGMAAANIIGLTGSIIRLACSLYFVYEGLGLIGLVLATICSEFISLLLQKIYFNRKNKQFVPRWGGPDMALLKEMMIFGMAYWGVNVSLLLTTGTDSIIIGSLYGAAAASVYYTTKIPTLLCIQLIYKISDNAAPAANELVAKGDLQILRSAYLKIIRYSLLLAVPLAIGVVTFNESMIGLWLGKEQYAGAVMSTALAFVAISQVINHANAMIVLAVGNMRHWMVVSVANGIATLALCYTLGKFFGMQWVMVGIAVMDIPMLLFLSRRVLQDLSLPYKKIWCEALRPVILLAFPLVGLSYFLITKQNDMDVVSVVVYMAIFALTWLICLYIFGIEEEERTSLKRKIAYSTTLGQ